MHEDNRESCSYFFHRLLSQLELTHGEKFVDDLFHTVSVVGTFEDQSTLFLHAPDLIVASGINYHYKEKIMDAIHALGYDMDVVAIGDVNLQELRKDDYQYYYKNDTCFDFRHLVIHEGNRRVVEAAKAFCRAKSGVFSVVGPRGSGKSHIASAMAKEINADKTEYSSSLTFEEACNKEDYSAYASDLFLRMARADVIIVEGIDDFAGKAAVEQKLVSLVNDVMLRGKRIILTFTAEGSDRFGDNLKMVLQYTFPFTLSLPDEMTRREIVRVCADWMVGEKLDKEVEDFIAAHYMDGSEIAAVLIDISLMLDLGMTPTVEDVRIGWENKCIMVP